jgi:neutral amino acid transport system ATP-binding protein
MGRHMGLLEVQNVSKAFGGIQALSDCSINVEQGTITGLIGPNGSGKTTLFNVITGYEQADKGTIRLSGSDITRATPEKVFGLGLGRTFQITRIFPRLTVLENMHIAARRESLKALLGRWSSNEEGQQALDLLDFVKLLPYKDKPASDLSYGQKKLLEFALVLVARPLVILLDEPAGGVNPTMINALADHIRTLNLEQAITFLVVEHNMEFVMQLCHSVNVMHRGTTIAQGPPDEVRKNPAVLDAYLGA